MPNPQNAKSLPVRVGADAAKVIRRLAKAKGCTPREAAEQIIMEHAHLERGISMPVVSPEGEQALSSLQALAEKARNPVSDPVTKADRRAMKADAAARKGGKL